MNMDLKTILASLASGALIATGATYATLETQATDLQASKHEILKQYVYAQARIGEVPTLDLTYATPEEYAQAYVELMNEKQAPKDDPDLFNDLHAQAIKDGTACK